jgi:enoyl-CoA hydratase
VTEGVLDEATTERVRVLTLNRPAHGNALDLELLGTLRSALRAADADTAVDVVVLTGADPAFCVGLDGADLMAPARADAMAEAVFASSRAWEQIGKPVIGAINGASERGGLELALLCDVLIASERATFADTHAALGVVPALGLTSLLPAAVGPGWAMRMSLTGDPVDATQALEMGLVTEVVAHDQLLPCARRLARRISSHPQAATRAVAQIYRTAQRDHLAGALETERQAHLELMEALGPSELVEPVLRVLRERDARERPGRD